MMKNLAISLIVISLLVTPAYGADWTKKDTYRHLAITALFVADRNQTIRISDNPDWYEQNTLLGEKPSRQSIDKYFLTTYALYSLSYYYLPKYRPVIFHSTLAIELYAIGNNLNLGVSINF